jgi:ABC-type nitrate/sulfonate/bicarbonate transport system substrate-binding protein
MERQKGFWRPIMPAARSSGQPRLGHSPPGALRAALLLVGAILVLIASACRAPAAVPAQEPPRSPVPAPAAPEAPTTTAPPRHVKTVLSTLSADASPVVVAQEAGFAGQHGLELELVVARSGAEAMAALLSQDAPIGSIGGNALINASAGGAELVMVAQQRLRFTYQVMAGPEVASPLDLRGKRLGVADVGGSSDLAAQYLLDKYGLRRGEDVAVVSLGSQNERLGGLQAGAVGAAMLQAPFTAAARKAGYQAIFDYVEEDYEVPSSGIVTSRAYARERQDTVQRFVAALADAIHYYKTDHAGTKAIVGRFLKQDDAEVLDEIYREAAGRSMPEIPYPSPRAVANAIQQVGAQNEAVARLEPADLMDDRYVRGLDEAGYFRTLYGR